MLPVLVIAVALGVWLLALLPLAVSRGKSWVLHEKRVHHLGRSGHPRPHRFAA
jgi:hypothetical protein